MADLRRRLERAIRWANGAVENGEPVPLWKIRKVRDTFRDVLGEREQQIDRELALQARGVIAALDLVLGKEVER